MGGLIWAQNARLKVGVDPSGQGGVKRERMKTFLPVPQTLGEWPLRMFRLKCDRCGRFGQYRTVTLVAKHGTAIEPVKLAEHLSGWCSRGRGLTRPAKMGQRRCELYFPDFMLPSNPVLPWRPR